MYEQHFGLGELPFTLTPNTRFFLNLPTHQEALNLILVALENGDGFVKIVGEVGTGKTLLCRKVLNALEGERYVSAYLPNPSLTPAELRRGFARELGLPLDADDGLELLERINQRLIALAGEGRRVVLIVDEAQAMPEETIEALRLLTNLETESSKLFQVVLFGQPELDEQLARPSLRQLRQRITFAYKLRTLDREGTGHYLQHRLNAAGYNGLPLFAPAAVALLQRASGGTPRLINILAHKAMMAAYGKGERRIGPALVRLAVMDTEGVALPLASRAPVPYLAAAGLTLVAGISLWLATGGML